MLMHKIAMQRPAIELAKVYHAVVKVLWTCVMQVLRKFRSYSVHVVPLEAAGIFNVEMIPYCGQV